MELFQLAAVLFAGGHDIDAGGLDAAVPQYIRKLGNVFANGIEAPGKQLAQVMGKDFSRIYFCHGAKPLHPRPYITAVQRLSAAGDENAASAYPPRLCKMQQPLFQHPRNQHGPGLIFTVDHHFSPACRLYGEIPQFGDADSGAAYGLQQQI